MVVELFSADQKIADTDFLPNAFLRRICGGIAWGQLPGIPLQLSGYQMESR